jgi:hypothetical protein
MGRPECIQHAAPARRNAELFGLLDTQIVGARKQRQGLAKPAEPLEQADRRNEIVQWIPAFPQASIIIYPSVFRALLLEQLVGGGKREIDALLAHQPQGRNEMAETAIESWRVEDA